MIKENTLPQIRLLSDEPSKVDEFSGGHKKVAQSLTAIINSAGAGKIIGLLGGWGSGKSTVVGFLQDDLKQKKTSKGLENEIFVFDAWKHQQDPIRRAFLESLIHHLDLENQLEDVLAHIKKAKETQSIQSTPIHAEEQLKIGTAIALFAIATVLLSNSKIIADLFVNAFEWKLAAVQGLILFFSIIMYIASALYADKFTKVPGFNALAAILLKTIPTVNLNTVIKTPEATAIEFQKYFKDIVDEYFKDKKKQLVVVIDNLDRIDAKEALAFWSTLSGFFSHRYKQEGDSLKECVWVILPIDSDALTKIFQNHDSAPKPVDGLGQPKPAMAVDHAQAFIEKTFALTLKVPPLIVSDWSKFFHGGAKEVFAEFLSAGVFKEERLYLIRRLLELKYHSSLTPRKIKNLLNNIGALYAQVYEWKIDILVCATYCIFDHELKISLKDFVTGASRVVPVEVFQIMESEEIEKWKEQIAVAHYLIEGKKAIEVLIGDEVEDALRRGNPEKVEKYFDVDGLRYCIEQSCGVKISSLATSMPHILANMAYSVSTLQAKGVYIEQTVWRQLISEFGTVDKWPHLIEEKLPLGVDILIKKKNNKDYSLKILASLGKVVDVAIQSDAEAAHYWMELYTLLVRHLTQCQMELTQIPIPELANSVPFRSCQLLVAGGNTELTSTIMDKILKNTDRTNLAQILGQKVTNRKLTAADISSIRWIHERDQKFDLTPIIEALRVNITQNENLDTGFYYIFEALHYLTRTSVKDHQSAVQVINELHQSGRIYLAYGSATNDNIRKGQIIGAVMNYAPHCEAPAGLADRTGFKAFEELLANPSSLDSAAINELMIASVKVINLSNMIDRAGGHSKLKPFVRKIVKHALETQQVDKLNLLYQHAASQTQKYYDVLEQDDAYALMEDASQNDAFYTKLKNNTNLDPVALFIKIGIGARGARFRQYMEERCQGLSAGEWKSQITSSSNFIKIVCALADKSGFSIATNEFEKAIMEIATTVVEVDTNLNFELAKIWNSLLIALGSSRRITLCRDMRAKICVSRVAGKSFYIQLQGKSFFTDGEFEQNADDVYRGVVMPLIKNGNRDEQKVLLDFKNEFAPILSKAKKESVDSLYQFIETKINNASSAAELDRFEMWRGYFNFADLEKNVTARRAQLKEMPNG